MSSGLFDVTTRGLEASLDLRLQRHNLTTSNIANAETPGYHAKKIDFEDRLAAAINGGHDVNTKPLGAGNSSLANSALDKVEGDIYDNPDGETNNDMNTVDVEKEMATLAENT